MKPLVAVAVPLIGGVVLLAALAALMLWYRSYRLRDEPPPPELTGEVPEPPAERDPTWDPRHRNRSA